MIGIHCSSTNQNFIKTSSTFYYFVCGTLFKNRVGLNDILATPPASPSTTPPLVSSSPPCFLWSFLAFFCWLDFNFGPSYQYGKDIIKDLFFPFANLWYAHFNIWHCVHIYIMTGLLNHKNSSMSLQEIIHKISWQIYSYFSVLLSLLAGMVGVNTFFGTPPRVRSLGFPIDGSLQYRSTEFTIHSELKRMPCSPHIFSFKIFCWQN